MLINAIASYDVSQCMVIKQNTFSVSNIIQCNDDDDNNAWRNINKFSYLCIKIIFLAQ